MSSYEELFEGGGDGRRFASDRAVPHRPSSGRQEPTDRIAIVGIVTRNRVASLVACLESYLDNCRRHDRSPEYVVIDDSPGAEAQDQTRAALQLVEHRVRAQIRYAGWREKSRFADALAHESAVPLEIIRFALFGDDRCALSTGANRNGLLLDTVDTLVLSVDDDTLCRSLPPDAECAHVLSGYDPLSSGSSPTMPAQPSHPVCRHRC